MRSARSGANSAASASFKGTHPMNDTDDSNNKPAHMRAQLAFNATVVALKELGSDPKFSQLSSLYLRGCEQLQQFIRERDRVR